MSYPNNKTFYKRNISIFYIMEFFSSLYFLIPIWVAFELRYVSLSQLATLEIIIFASQIILELPTGALADLLGKKPTIFLGMLISGASFVAFGLSSSFNDLLFSCLLTGIGYSLRSGAKEAMLFDTLKQVGKENIFDKISSKLSMIFQIGMAAATLVGGFLSLIHFRLPSIATGIAIMFGSLFVLFLFEPTIDTEKFTLINYIKQTKKGFMELFKTKYSTLISIFYGLVGGITFSIEIVFTKLIMTELLFSDTEMGIVFSIIGIVGSLILYLIVNKTKLLDRKRTMFLFAILIPISLMPGLLFNKTIIIPFVLLMMLLSAARWSLLGKYTNDVFSSKNRATAISSLSIFTGLIYILVMLLSGPVMEMYNGSKVFFTVIGIISLITITPLGIYLSKMNLTKNKSENENSSAQIPLETPAL